MDQLYPLVCALSPEKDKDLDEPGNDAGDQMPAEQPTQEPMADLPKEIWTKPLTQRQWEVACAMIMYWAQHGGC